MAHHCGGAGRHGCHDLCRQRPGLPGRYARPGISAEDLPYIFDRYYRSRSDAGKQGTGLGLSITKAIFQQHGFRFGVQSTVGKGTTFWFIMTDTDSSDN